MVGPLRRWRPLLAVAAIWLLACWYMFSGDSLVDRSRIVDEPTSVHLDFGGGEGKVRWTKLPDRYPVATPRPLPAGRPEAPIPKIQKSPPPEESKEARRIRQARLTAVKESFQHSWKGYKTHAWLQDEVAPLTKRPKQTFGGWAATLVDALDSLWIMGMQDEFRMAVKACEKIDFTYTQAPSINVFETTIRYLGGFLAAYEISGKNYPALLNKAVEVGELLMCAFDTPNRMPISRWDWQGYVHPPADGFCRRLSRLLLPPRMA